MPHYSNRLKKRFIFCMAMLALLLPFSAAWPAADAQLPVTHGKLMRDYARITFEWPQPVYFKAEADGKKLTITFERPANPDFRQMLSQLYPYVTSARREGKTVVLSLDKPYRIRTFISDNVSGVDLLGIDPAKRVALKKGTGEPANLAALSPATGTPLPAKEPASPVGEEKEKPKETATVPPPAKPAEPVATPAETKAAEEDKPSTAQAEAKPAEIAPAAGPKEDEKTPETAVPSALSAAPAMEAPILSKPGESPIAAETTPATSTAIPSMEQIPPLAQEPEQPASPAAAAKPSEEPPSLNDSIALPPPPQSTFEPPPQVAAPAVPASPATPGVIKVGVSAAEDNAAIRFPLAERTAAAVFVRMGSLWIVFDHAMEIDLSDFNELPPTVIGKAEMLSGEGVTGLRMPVDDRVFVSVVQEQGTFEWSVLVTPKGRPLEKPLAVTLHAEPPVPPYVFVPAIEAAKPITVRDPQLGDELIVVPVFKTGEGIARRREFVEFTLLETVQGVAVVKKADGVEVTELRNGLSVSVPEGAILSPNLPEVTALPKSDMRQNIATLFPFEKWKLDPEADRRQIMQGLFRGSVTNAELRGANDARLRMAQIYLSEGLAPEAIGMLDGIVRTDPVYFRSEKLAAMRGAANFLMYRFADATRDFAASELNNNKEIGYWRSMLSDLAGNPGEAYDYIAMNDDYISKYPPVFRQRLAIVAADRSIDAKEYNTALKVFDILHQDKLLEPIKPYVNYLLAKISADTGQEEEAVAMWDKLADDHKHPFVQSRAEFSRIVWGMDHGTLERDQVIDRLEKLRLAWHGDGLELKVLMMLGDLYYEKKDYINAMRVWDGAVTSFTNTSAAVTMFRKMEDTFVAMFNEGIADQLSPLEALALYYQYRNFAPPGTLGNEMTNRLADRLVGVDLLDQAAALLDHQMRFQSEKEQRSRIGAKLASIHLLNHQPKKALAVLEDSVYGENAVLLRLQRNRLAAEALAELKQSDQALQVLGQDDSAEAERIRLSVYWQEKDWPKVIASVESMLKARKDITAPVTIDESEFLMKLALAYVFENNTVQLQYLRDYFAPLMEKNPNKEIFNFITAGDIQITPTTFDDLIQRLSETRHFIDNYSARIETAGLEDNGKAAAPAAAEKQ